MARKQVGASFSSNVNMKLTRLDQKIQKHLLDHVRKSAKDIQELAKLNVPVDEGSVENAIVVEETRTGINRAYEFHVGVDSEKVRTDRAARGIDDDYPYFDVWLHESNYDLGEKSQEKALAVKHSHPKAAVGNKYLERAYQGLRREIAIKANKIAKDIAKREER